MKSFHIDISYFCWQGWTECTSNLLTWLVIIDDHLAEKHIWRTWSKVNKKHIVKSSFKRFFKSRCLVNGFGVCSCAALFIYEFHVFSCTFFFFSHTYFFSRFLSSDSIQFVLFALKRILNRRFFFATISLFGKKKKIQWIYRNPKQLGCRQLQSTDQV